jgi:hypothetical protein
MRIGNASGLSTSVGISFMLTMRSCVTSGVAVGADANRELEEVAGYDESAQTGEDVVERIVVV